MKFGEAIEALRSGCIIRREAWKPDMRMIIGDDFDWRKPGESYFVFTDEVEARGHGHLISVNDVLAEDWVICWELGQGFPVDNEGESGND